MDPFDRVVGHLYHNWQDRMGGQGGWHNWTRDFRAAPAMFFITSVNRLGSNRHRTQTFALDPDGTLIHN